MSSAISAATASTASSTCCICSKVIQQTENKKVLACLHQFHQTCIDLQRARLEQRNKKNYTCYNCHKPYEKINGNDEKTSTAKINSSTSEKTINANVEKQAQQK